MHTIPVFCFLLISLHVSNCQWTTSTLYISRSNLVATSIQGRFAFFAGGSVAGSGMRTDIVDLYNATSSSWSTTVLSEKRINLAATSVGNIALFAGGDGTTQAESDRVDIYDSDSDSWSTATLSLPRSSLAATSVGRFALFGGGGTRNYAVNGSDSNIVDIYNYATKEWTTATLSLARRSLVAASVGNIALFAGGVTTGEFFQYPSDRVDIYNYATKEWTTATLSLPRYQLAATSVGNFAIFAGGMVSENRVTGVVDIYDAKSNSWFTTEITPRYLATAVSVGNIALIAGGLRAGRSSLRDVFYWNSTSRQMQSMGIVFLTGRYGMAGTSVGDLAFFSGGYPDFLDSLEIFNYAAFTKTGSLPCQQCVDACREENVISCECGSLVVQCEQYNTSGASNVAVSLSVLVVSLLFMN